MQQNFWWENIYRTAEDYQLPWEEGEPRPELKELINKKIISPPAKVLDVGCGLGTQTVFLASKRFKTYGIDFAPSAIKRAKEKAYNADIKVSFRVGNVLDLPYDDNFFDFVFDFGCLHHNLESASRYIWEIQKVLKEEGLYLLFAFQSRISEKEIEELFEKYFNIIDISAITHIERPTGMVHGFWKVLARKSV